MTAWRTLPLGRRTVNLDRRRVPVTGKNRRPGPYRYYGASGVVDYVDSYLFDGLHLLVAEDGENLRTRKTPVAFLADGQFWVNNHAHVLQANEHNDLRFLAYAVEASDISGFITGSTQPKLSQAALNEIPITAPDVRTQRAIAATLGTLDDKIQSNQRTIRIAESLVDALAEELAHTIPGVPLSTLAEVSRETTDPRRLGDVLVDHFSLPAFDAGAVPERVPASAIMSNKLTVSRPSILVSRLNPRFNRTWWASPAPGVKSLASTEFLALTATDQTELAGLWLAARDPYFIAELARRVTGTSGSHQRVRPEDVLAIEVPDVSKASGPVRSVALGLLQRISSVRAESAALVACRNALLPELLSGRIRVPVAAEALV